MKNLTIRKAAEADRKIVADLAAECFYDDFRLLVRGVPGVANLLSECVVPQRFYLAYLDGEPVGISAVSDNTGRCSVFTREVLRRHISGVMLLFSKKTFEELSRPMCTPDDTVNIEYVGVSEKARGKGISRLIVEEIVRETDYRVYTLDVKGNNAPAMKTYTRLGFVEYKRERQKFPLLAGFKELVYMKYIKPEQAKG